MSKRKSLRFLYRKLLSKKYIVPLKRVHSKVLKLHSNHVLGCKRKPTCKRKIGGWRMKNISGDFITLKMVHLHAFWGWLNDGVLFTRLIWSYSRSKRKRLRESLFCAPFLLFLLFHVTIASKATLQKGSSSKYLHKQILKKTWLF